MTDNLGSEDRLRVLEAVTDTALAHLELDTLLDTLLRRIREVLDVDTATVLLLDRSAQQLVATAAAGLEEEVLHGIRVPVGAGFAGRVAATKQPVIIDRVDDTTVINSLLWERGLRVLLGVPMLARGELAGVLHVGSTKVRRFTQSDIDLLQLVADRLSLAAQAEMSRTERTAAAALQRSLLPGRLPTIRGLEFAARYVPGADNGVGGDWYDVFTLPDDRLGLVIGDVAGHGLNAAIVMGRLRSALRAYALESSDPGVVLSKLDRKASHFEHGAMATVGYAIVDVAQHEMHLSLAGHLPPVLVHPEHGASLVHIPVDPPVGHGLAITGRRSVPIELPLGGLIAFYTDGLVERRDQSIDFRLAKLCATATTETPEVVCRRIMTAMIGSQPAQDDIAVLAARRTAPAASDAV